MLLHSSFVCWLGHVAMLFIKECALCAARIRSAFRRMLKGVCDGDLLLDGQARICGDSSCLQRLLGTQDELTGKRFSDLIDEHQRFDDFLAESAKKNANHHGTPRCCRVALNGAEREVPVDVFHVELPKRLGTSADCHLLALIEDADARLRAEASQNLHADPAQNPLAHGPGPGLALSASESQSSCSSESYEMFEELSQLTLLLDCSTEMIDIKEAHARFARITDEAHMKLGMPTLKRLIRPSDWPAVQAQLSHLAHRGTTHKGTARSQTLPPMMLRVPGEQKRYVHAKGASVKAAYSGFRPQGVPAYLQLTLNKFHKRQVMAGVHEDPLEYLAANDLSYPGDVQRQDMCKREKLLKARKEVKRRFCCWTFSKWGGGGEFI